MCVPSRNKTRRYTTRHAEHRDALLTRFVSAITRALRRYALHVFITASAHLSLCLCLCPLLQPEVLTFVCPPCTRSPLKTTNLAR